MRQVSQSSFSQNSCSFLWSVEPCESPGPLQRIQQDTGNPYRTQNCKPPRMNSQRKPEVFFLSKLPRICRLRTHTTQNVPMPKTVRRTTQPFPSRTGQKLKQKLCGQSLLSKPNQVSLQSPHLVPLLGTTCYKYPN